MEIFKVQRPLMTTEEELKYLIYNKDQSLITQISPAPKLIELMGDAYKIYVIGHLTERNTISLTELCEPHEEPDW